MKTDINHQDRASNRNTHNIDYCEGSRFIVELSIQAPDAEGKLKEYQYRVMTDDPQSFYRRFSETGLPLHKSILFSRIKPTGNSGDTPTKDPAKLKAEAEKLYEDKMRAYTHARKRK